MAGPDTSRRPLALVLSGGGARGAYEAGVLSYLYEHILPRCSGGREFDITSGTSVGAIHAAYTTATRGMPGSLRARGLLEGWEAMRVSEMLHLNLGDLVRIPLRLAGLRPRAGGSTLGGLVDLSRLEELITSRVPWDRLERVLAGEDLGLCVSCTEVRSGRVVVFMAGTRAHTRGWKNDPSARAEKSAIGPEHVRASAAIPFLFPAVRIGERYYVDGGLRMNTPLSPALRLGAERALVVCLRHPPSAKDHIPTYPESVIAAPSFMLGKVLNALTLDQLEYELKRLELINYMIARGEEYYGGEFLEHMNVAVRERRGTGYRSVAVETLRPSEDLGQMASESFAEGRAEMGLVARFLARVTIHNAGREADLLSYLLFDRAYTRRLVELGRADAEGQRDALEELLECETPEATG